MDNMPDDLKPLAGKITQPLDAAGQQVGAAEEKLAGATDAVSNAVDQGAAKLAQGIDTFVEKQESVFNALDNFLKKF